MIKLFKQFVAITSSWLKKIYQKDSHLSPWMILYTIIMSFFSCGTANSGDQYENRNSGTILVARLWASINWQISLSW